MDFDLARLMNSESFNSFWFWLIVAVSWSRMTHFSLGAGLHDVRDAMRNGGADMDDLESMIHVNSRKLTNTFDKYGVWISSIGMFLIATIVTLGFKFNIEMMQALGMLLIGLLIGNILALRFAYRVISNNLRGSELCTGFTKLRMAKQFVGIVAIFVTSFYAAYFLVILRGI